MWVSSLEIISRLLKRNIHEQLAVPQSKVLAFSGLPVLRWSNIWLFVLSLPIHFTHDLPLYKTDCVIEPLNHYKPKAQVWSTIHKASKQSLTPGPLLSLKVHTTDLWVLMRFQCRTNNKNLCVSKFSRAVTPWLVLHPFTAWLYNPQLSFLWNVFGVFLCVRACHKF